MTAPMPTVALPEDALDALLDALDQHYGYDFRHYARGSLRRRINATCGALGLDRLSALHEALLADPANFEVLLRHMSVTVTEMFRDPEFFRAFRERVVPQLSTYPYLRIWHAGCATGEEVYSMAILLRECGLEPRSRLFATDYNKVSLDAAREGVYPLAQLGTFTRNYQLAGGTASFADYYSAHYEFARLDPSLREQITFAHHNLVTDGVFGEMHVVVCRNVLIYFDKALQQRAFGLFHDSLCRLGILCLGAKESLLAHPRHDEYQELDHAWRIFRKMS